jgi:hypothetical protein
MGILFEGFAFLLVLGALALAGGYALVRWTPLGLRLKQVQNRKRLEAELELTCPIHGRQDPNTLVRLRSGQTLCSQCFKEAVDDVATDESV